MFVVLRTVSPEKGIIKRRKQKKRILNSPAQSCPTEKGLPFYVLDVLADKHGIDWDSVAEKCGRYASRIIAPRNLPLPDHEKLRRFIPISMNSLLIFNTASEIIKNAALPPEKISVTLTDRNAVHYSRVCKLLPFASSVRVVTAHPERYAHACVRAFEDYGASLIIRSVYEPTSKPEIIICCDGTISVSMENAAIFTSKRRAGGKIRFSGNGARLSEHHADLIPQEIDPIDFIGALTELCGCPEYKSSTFAQLDISCTSCENPTPEKCLECFCANQ